MPTSFTITVESLRDLEDLWAELNEFECETLDGLFEHVSKRLEEETERG
ncbi:hypothetical protein [Pseudodesulfovibrio methanolicus]|uniref:CopG family transcriptional regulator n=1 Tax=Pseudodesulfovibrio methanolicus TaxID=3126690 RepID=A0ABZ2IZI9_9BACT